MLSTHTRSRSTLSRVGMTRLTFGAGTGSARCNRSMLAGRIDTSADCPVRARCSATARCPATTA